MSKNYRKGRFLPTQDFAVVPPHLGQCVFKTSREISATIDIFYLETGRLGIYINFQQTTN